MKSLSGKFQLVALGAIGVGAVLTLRAFAQPPSSEKFVLRINSHHSLKNSTDAGETAFAALLCNGHYTAAKGNQMKMKHGNAQKPDNEYPRDCGSSGSAAGPGAQLEIKTDKVIVSETAKRIEAGELTVIQAHATIQIACPGPGDIKAVLDQLAP
jgi:hypothetical protein